MRMKDFENGFKLDAFERADYIIFGFPKNCIEGILVGRVVENNQEYLKEIKSLFPNSYICITIIFKLSLKCNLVKKSYHMLFLGSNSSIYFLWRQQFTCKYD